MLRWLRFSNDTPLSRDFYFNFLFSYSRAREYIYIYIYVLYVCTYIARSLLDGFNDRTRGWNCIHVVERGRKKSADSMHTYVFFSLSSNSFITDSDFFYRGFVSKLRENLIINYAKWRKKAPLRETKEVNFNCVIKVLTKSLWEFLRRKEKV